MSDIVEELASRLHNVAEQNQAEAMRQLQTALESTEAECKMLRAEIVILEHRLARCAQQLPKKYAPICG